MFIGSVQAAAQSVVRCGNTYSASPSCTDGQALNAPDARSNEQRLARQKQTTRELDAIHQIEQQRQEEANAGQRAALKAQREERSAAAQDERRRRLDIAERTSRERQEKRARRQETVTPKRVPMYRVPRQHDADSKPRRHKGRTPSDPRRPAFPHTPRSPKPVSGT